MQPAPGPGPSGGSDAALGDGALAAIIILCIVLLLVVLYAIYARSRSDLGRAGGQCLRLSALVLFG